MSQVLQIHPENPQAHLIRQAVNTLRAGGVIVYPTDSGYALGCQMGNKTSLERIKQIRQLDKKHYMTLVCRDLSELAAYAQVDNYVYRLLRAHTPGAYTFILPATREVPRRLQHPNRKTIGLRVPDNVIAMNLLEALEEPLLSSTLILPGSDMPLIEPQAIQEILGRQVDLIIDAGACEHEPTTVIDLVDSAPRIIRKGKGDITPFL